MKNFSRKGFTLVESLAMMVTLVVFGWLCLAVFRYQIRADKTDVLKPKYAAEDRVERAAKSDEAAKAAQPTEKPWKGMMPPPPAPEPAPTPAPAKP